MPSNLVSFDSLLIWLLAAGIAQGAFLSIALVFLDVRNKNASRLLAALIAVMTLMIAAEFLDVLGAPFDFRIGLASEFATAPLILLALRTIGDPAFQLRRRHGFHFLPLAIAALAIMSLQVCCGELIFSHSNRALLPGIAFWTLVKVPYFFGYAYFADRHLVQALKPARRRRAGMLRWVRIWFLVLFALIAFSYANFFLFVLNVPIAPEPDSISGIIIAAMLFSVAYFLIVNRQILDAEPKEPVEGLAQRAITYIETHQLVVDPDLSLLQLATALQVSEANLAQAFSADFDGGFNEFLNKQRVEVFDRLLKDTTNRNRTILDLAFEAGFNSKATFYRVFKAMKGVTPSAWRTQFIEKSELSASQTAD